ncbi:UNVERIFIED_ORG: type I restriction enzyme M protein [Rahnella aquatilis]
MTLNANLVCPIRGQLGATYFAKDGLTVSEEARRIECLKYLLLKKYPKSHIECETVVIKRIGNGGRNSLRADIVVYDLPVLEARSLSDSERNKHILLVAEIKRESKSKKSAVSFQLEPALRQIDRSIVYGVYWDDTNRHLYIKKVEDGETLITRDELGNIPVYGHVYKYSRLKYGNLIKPEDISATLMDIANILRSNHINDDATRYRETVKLLLAKYVDEKDAKESGDDLVLQVAHGNDYDFMDRVKDIYARTARIYSKAKSIFGQASVNFLPEKTMKEIVEKIQGLDLLNSSSDSMQQVFMTFVPAVFKKDLDQFFTPLTLINCMVEILRPGPNDKIADPAMGTADFLTATMQYRFKYNDGQIINRVFGSDKDPQAYELAVINMILNKDGQTNLHDKDTIEEHLLWADAMDIAFCNPPFGSRTVETRKKVLEKYDLGHVWVSKNGVWTKTEEVMQSQQLGILFIERCWKLLAEKGRMGIILPEGYLCTASYGYVRQWLLDKFKILGLVELPRRIFLKSEADLRSNILFAYKKEAKKNDGSDEVDYGNYPIHTELVRKVGYKLGKGFFTMPLRDLETGLEIRNEDNEVVIDTDFIRVRNNFLKFIKFLNDPLAPDWDGARVGDILSHPMLDMKPRRLSRKALSNARIISQGEYVRLGDVAEVLDRVEEFDVPVGENMHLIEGQDIRAVEGMVVLKDSEKKWQVEVRKTNKGYKVRKDDVIVGLVRPERRNIGFYAYEEPNVYASGDGVAIVRQKPGQSEIYPIEWIFQALRTERCRLQFWTESGGTSYGKLTIDQIKNVMVPVPSHAERLAIKKSVQTWALSIIASAQAFNQIWPAEDKKAILNSPLIGLESEDLNSDDDE